jgi:PAS domain-containing protein
MGVPFFDSEGRITRWYGLVTDIDDRKRTEDALRESELTSLERFTKMISMA